MLNSLFCLSSGLPTAKGTQNKCLQREPMTASNLLHITTRPSDLRNSTKQEPTLLCFSLQHSR